MIISRKWLKVSMLARNGGVSLQLTTGGRRSKSMSNVRILIQMMARPGVGFVPVDLESHGVEGTPKDTLF